jgi:uncharacterized membrane protein
MSLIEYLDNSHILEKINNIEKSLIIEIIVITILINLGFSYIYLKIYEKNKESFIEIKEELNGKKLSLFDFFYFSNTTFFSLGYDIIPKSTLSRSICIFHMILGFLVSTVFIAKIIS